MSCYPLAVVQRWSCNFVHGLFSMMELYKRNATVLHVICCLLISGIAEFQPLLTRSTWFWIFVHFFNSSLISPLYFPSFLIHEKKIKNLQVWSLPSHHLFPAYNEKGSFGNIVLVMLFVFFRNTYKWKNIEIRVILFKHWKLLFKIPNTPNFSYGWNHHIVHIHTSRTKF